MPGGYGNNFRAPKVDVHQFAMVPRFDVPRSSFRMQMQHKTTFSASLLIPFFCTEVLPGDSFALNCTAFVRMATPIFPIMDNMDLETFFFFVPNRLVWINWYKFMGEQENPADSISFTIPQIVSPAGGFAQLSIYDYFGLPTAGQTVGGNTISISALPLRAYQIIWNQWFRDENLQNAAVYGSGGGTGIAAMDNGPDPSVNYALLKANKRHDYFTSCLPWQTKGGANVPIMSAQPAVKTSSSALLSGASNAITFLQTGGTAPTANVGAMFTGGGGLGASTTAATLQGTNVYPSNLFADLSVANGNSIALLRFQFQTQKWLERDARGGTRYTEIIRSHFGVISPDARLQRPEYLGGGKSPVNITPVPQTSGTSASGTTTPLGTLAAVGTTVGRPHGFRQAFTEHGHVIGLCCVRSDMGYQQGIRKMWSRSVRYDFYWPEFAMLAEQAVLQKEIFSDGSAGDSNVFGYQEHWAEYRYLPSMTTAYFRSTTTTPLDAWHLVEKFGVAPTLSGGFIQNSTDVIIQRCLAAAGGAINQQFLADFFFDIKAARPMPLYSVPGLADHF